ncbi:MAG: hypothetical protein ABW051_00010 [Burkholderiaceae bacterium]
MTICRAPFAVLATALFAGCSGMAGGPERPLYRCEHGVDFRADFIDDSVVLDGPGGRDVLYRDAGGEGPAQKIYANPRMKAEFGLGASGREAIIRYPLLPLVARCVRD